IHYIIVVHNQSAVRVKGARVIDNVPSQLTLAHWTCTVSAGSHVAVQGGKGNINTTVNLAAGGTATFQFTAMIKPGARGTLSNTARVAMPAGVTDADLSNNVATDTDTLLPRVDLRVAMAAPALVQVGQQLTYTLTISNRGPSTATNVVLIDQLPAGLRFVSAS